MEKWYGVMTVYLHCHTQKEPNIIDVVNFFKRFLTRLEILQKHCKPVKIMVTTRLPVLKLVAGFWWG